MEPSRSNNSATDITSEVLTYEAPVKTPLLHHPLVRRLRRTGDWMFLVGFIEVVLFIWLGRYFYKNIPQTILPILPACGVAAMVGGGICSAPYFVIKYMDKFHK